MKVYEQRNSTAKQKVMQKEKGGKETHYLNQGKKSPYNYDAWAIQIDMKNYTPGVLVVRARGYIPA